MIYVFRKIGFAFVIGFVLLGLTIALNTYHPDKPFLLIIFVGASLMLWSSVNFLRYYRAKFWLETIATLQSVEVHNAPVPSGSGKLTYLYPSLIYEFKVYDVRYTGNRASIELENIWVLDYKKKNAPWIGWHNDTEISVFYSPKNPEESCVFRDLSRKRRSHHLALFISGVLILAFGFLIMKIMPS